jgi:hypothetical protein
MIERKTLPETVIGLVNLRESPPVEQMFADEIGRLEEARTDRVPMGAPFLRAERTGLVRRHSTGSGKLRGPVVRDPPNNIKGKKSPHRLEARALEPRHGQEINERSNAVHRRRAE